jgi:hypothetical protein
MTTLFYLFRCFILTLLIYDIGIGGKKNEHFKNVSNIIYQKNP